MADVDQAHEHSLSADPADEIAAALMDVQEALNGLLHATQSIVCCEECDPDGSRLRKARADLAEVHDVNWVAGEYILSHAADAREWLQNVTGRPHCHCDDEESGDD